MSKRCCECEISLLDDVPDDEDLCGDCAENRPFASKNIDHIYVGNPRKNTSVVIITTFAKQTVRYIEEKPVQVQSSKRSKFAESKIYTFDVINNLIIIC